MNWIEVGGKFINMALVTQVFPFGTGVRLYFQAPEFGELQGSIVADTVDLFGKEADAVKRWLVLNSEDINLID